jgi:y4mF family transcriptional regulator
VRDSKQSLATKMGQAIQKQRKSLELTQEDLARFSGCSLPYIGQIEAGKASARMDKLQDVLNVLGLQLRLELGKNGLCVDENLK